MDRLQEKNELFTKLGALFGPLQRLADDPESYDEQERPEVIARYCAEYERLIGDFSIFSQGQAGHRYTIELHKFRRALGGVVSELTAGKPVLAHIVSHALEVARAAIAAIPIPRSTTIFEAQTPFSTYCAIRDLVEGDTTEGLLWVDAYMAPSIFHRYLRNVKSAVGVTLVTCEPKVTAGRRDRDRWNLFLDGSRLYALERGVGCYRLVVHKALHDRWLLLDDKRLYALGGSVKDAGDKQYFTLARVEATPENLTKIQKHTDTGKEYFGTSTPQHL